MKRPVPPPTPDEARDSAREAMGLQLRKLLKAACAERDKLAKRLTVARAKSKADREAIATMIEDEARLFKSTAPCLIVPGYDLAAAHLVGLELEHLARKVRHGDLATRPLFSAPVVQPARTKAPWFRDSFQAKHGTAERWEVCDCADCVAAKPKC